MSMPFLKISIGEKINNWTIIEDLKAIKKVNENRCVLARCKCGRIKKVEYSHIRRGNSKSCTSCANSKRNTVHGLTKHVLFHTWSSMLDRCENPKAINYKNYGGRGIEVCKRWHDVKKFIKDMHPRPEGLTLDRINNNKGYKPSNCKWSTISEQSKNRRPKSLTARIQSFIKSFEHLDAGL